MLQQLLCNEKLQTLQHALQNNESILIEELWNSPKALITAIAEQQTHKHILLLTGGSQEEIRLYHDFAFFTHAPVVDFPAWETMPSENIAPSPDIVGERYKVLRDIQDSTHPYIIISSLQACLQKLIPPSRFKKLFLTLKVGDIYPFDALIKQLEEMGYERHGVAADKGQFAVRGGIIDVFPVSTPDPYRIEFWGDDIESIRIYDPIGQKSIKPSPSIDITPAREKELLANPEELKTIFHYLGDRTLVIFDDLLSLEDRYASLVNIGGSSSPTFCTIENLLDQLAPLQKIFLSQQPIDELSKTQVLGKVKGSFYSENAPLVKMKFEIFNRDFVALRWQNPFISITDYLLPELPPDEEVSGQELLCSLSRLTAADYQLHILCASEPEENNFNEKIKNSQLTLPKHTTFHRGYLSCGFILPDTKVMLFPITEITQRYKIRRQKQRSTYHIIPAETFDLLPGEMVVHLNHGIGRYLGIEKRPDHNGVQTEFLQLEYADLAKLYVPIQQAFLISRYIGSSEEIPRLHTLGSNRWRHTKEQTQQAIIGYAKDLLQLYARRSTKSGFAYPQDAADMISFEDEFPYDPTEDQIAAITAIKQDMTSELSMDRLVCGDVGYGKTEVAMRAAFKAVADGQKQVAVLVPTTVLAMQHYDTFIDRMRNFAVNIGVLSRFQSAKETRETLKGISEGTIDIVIGTHRLVSKDVQFKDLGLVIIDEEQRFGVKAKEHLKQIKHNVDCLTLSATPIPRTLYMSLVGARDMSVISTPPQDRLPITTIISEPADQVYKSALLRELSRDGQAFIIHNRVETIYGVADRVKKLLPQARVVVAHGQMHSDEIDAVFHAFKKGDADILVATTIVENGIDIPNANTILIEQADHYGMADLYQLRGRVGRWNRRAYAYMLVKRPQGLPEIARKRLKAIAESSGYGGGMKVAMHDLEIRGAGNILGTEQSGYVSSIGFHLYCKLLKRAVKAFQGETLPQISDIKFDFYLDARLPEDYVNAINMRMEFYHRFGEAVSLEEVDAIWAEVVDRFGRPPDPALNLYHMTRVRVFAAKLGYTVLKLDKLSLTAEGKNGSRKILLGPMKSPSELEQRIVKALVDAS